MKNYGKVKISKQRVAQELQMTYDAYLALSGTDLDYGHCKGAMIAIKQISQTLNIELETQEGGK